MLFMYLHTSDAVLILNAGTCEGTGGGGGGGGAIKCIII